MNHWHREHFSTHQFYADVIFCFASHYDHEELDLLESGRDRHGYDCVLIRTGASQPLTRYIQLKSTENESAPILGVRGPMLLTEHREIVQIRVSEQGHCEYYFLSDFGRIAHLALAIANVRVAKKSTDQQPEVLKALKPLSKLIGGFRPPTSYRDIQKQWSSLQAGDWPVWDGQLKNVRGQLWADVIRPLASSFEVVFPEWRSRHDVESRWTRKIARKDLIDHLFR